MSARATDGAGRTFMRVLAPQLGVAVVAGQLEGWLELAGRALAVRFWGGAVEGFSALVLQFPVALLAALLLAMAGPTRRLDPRRQVALSWALGLAGAVWPLALRLLSLAIQRQVLAAAGGAVAALAVGLAAGHLLRDRRLPGWRSGLAAALLLGLVPMLAMRLLGEPVLPAPPPAPARAEAAPPADAPCILLVSVDTLRDDRVGAVRDGVPLTPALDALAAEGRRLSCEAPANQTVPGHVSLLTGAPALRHGTFNNRQVLPSALPTLAAAFQAAGWRTAGVISNPLLRGIYGFARGFDVYDDAAMVGDARVQAVNQMRWASARWSLLWTHDRLMAPITWLAGYEEFRAMERGEVTAGRARALLRGLIDPQRPFLLFCHFMDPHSPYRAPGGWGGAFTTPEERGSVNAFGTRGFMVQIRLLEQRLLEGEAGAEETLDVLGRLYDEEVRYADHCIGEVLEAAREAAGDRPLWVVVTADHGEHFGENLWRGGRPLEHARTLLEPETRVPLVISGWEPAAAPRSLDEVARALAQAALERRAQALAAGLPPDLPLVQGFQEGRRRFEFAIREGGWKLILEADGRAGPFRPLALFHLDEDPGEQENRLAKEGERAAALLSRFQELDAQVEEVPREAWESGPDAKTLADLGYAGG